jgi:hypothetical protein
MISSHELVSYITSPDLLSHIQKCGTTPVSLTWTDCKPQEIQAYQEIRESPEGSNSFPSDTSLFSGGIDEL